jgi:phenylacetate-CoA ligase
VRDTPGDFPTPVSAVEGVAWPAIPDRTGNIFLALLYQLEQSQWWPAERIAAQQFRQAGLLLRHARDTVPHYRRTLAGLEWDGKIQPDEALWRQLPLLRREDLQQDEGSALLSERYPQGHGKTSKTRTSGSSGKPVTVTKSMLPPIFWNVLTLRDFLWRRVDFADKIAAIRFDESRVTSYPDGVILDHWLRSLSSVVATGECAVLDIATPVDKQAEWLARQAPAMLITYPSNLEALLQHCRAHDIRLPTLKRVQTLSEALPPGLRALCQAVWGFGVDDMYSCQEAGYIALQCPDHAHYHVQSENLLVEILDDDGMPVAPGESGRVVISDLHNFAMPLIRYEIGDFAEAGEPCPCGRGLPVLNAVMGRVRGMMTLADGARIRPDFGGPHFREVADIRQYQIVQKSRTRLEVKLVAPGGLSEAERGALVRLILDRLGHPFELDFSFHAEIPRGPGGKFEDFRSEI